MRWKVANVKGGVKARPAPRNWPPIRGRKRCCSTSFSAGVRINSAGRSCSRRLTRHHNATGLPGKRNARHFSTDCSLDMRSPSNSGNQRSPVKADHFTPAKTSGPGRHFLKIPLLSAKIHNKKPRTTERKRTGGAGQIRDTHVRDLPQHLHRHNRRPGSL